MNQNNEVKKRMTEKKQMKLWIIVAILGILVIFSGIQAIELSSLKNSVSGVGNTDLVGQTGSSTAPNLQNIQSPPTMVGGCWGEKMSSYKKIGAMTIAGGILGSFMPAIANMGGMTQSEHLFWVIVFAIIFALIGYAISEKWGEINEDKKENMVHDRSINYFDTFRCHIFNVRWENWRLKEKKFIWSV